MSKLEEYLARGDVSLGVKISTLVREGLHSPNFISLAEDLIKTASTKESREFQADLLKLAQLVQRRTSK